MRALIMRHARAGRREPWNLDDVSRHLSDDGRIQAQMIAQEFRTVQFTALFSSPYPRCVETLEPLAEVVGVETKVDDRLSEATTMAALESFMLTLDRNGVFAACSHGNVVPAIVELLIGRQVQHLPMPILSPKGSVWDIEIEGGVATSVRFYEPLSQRTHAYL